jgi:threonine aldolase
MLSLELLRPLTLSLCLSRTMPCSLAHQSIRRYAYNFVLVLKQALINCRIQLFYPRLTAGGMATLSQAMVQPVWPRNSPNLTLEDVQREVVLGNDVHYAPTRVIALENTYGGTILPLKEVQRISDYARAHDIRIHCDGARLWNAVAAGAGSFREYGAAFDSISLCFSKGIGAPVGSILVGSKSFVERARWIRKSIGGGMRQTGIIAGAARAALDEVFPKLVATHETARDIEKHLHSLGLKTVLPVETNMIFIVSIFLSSN